ncbi:unnamed protein product, partial [Ectocarpus sp. 12 AP-2014]
MGIAEEVYVSVIAYSIELDVVWCLIQGFLLHGGAEEDGRSLDRLRVLLTKALHGVENRFETECDLAEAARRHSMIYDGDIVVPSPGQGHRLTPVPGVAATASRESAGGGGGGVSRGGSSRRNSTTSSAGGGAFPPLPEVPLSSTSSSSAPGSGPAPQQ